MIASAPWNPDRRLSFTDMVIAELEKLSRQKKITPVEYSYATDFTRVNTKPITRIYSGRVGGLKRAVMSIVNMTRKRIGNL
jgi:hypothetical protein